MATRYDWHFNRLTLEEKVRVAHHAASQGYIISLRGGDIALQGGEDVNRSATENSISKRVPVYPIARIPSVSVGAKLRTRLTSIFR